MLIFPLLGDLRPVVSPSHAEAVAACGRAGSPWRSVPFLEGDGETGVSATISTVVTGRTPVQHFKGLFSYLTWSTVVTGACLIKSIFN